MAGASTAGGAGQLNAADVLIYPRLKETIFLIYKGYFIGSYRLRIQR
jgi:hypothetical protein